MLPLTNGDILIQLQALYSSEVQFLYCNLPSNEAPPPDYHSGTSGWLATKSTVLQDIHMFRQFGFSCYLCTRFKCMLWCPPVEMSDSTLSAITMTYPDLKKSWLKTCLLTAAELQKCSSGELQAHNYKAAPQHSQEGTSVLEYCTCPVNQWADLPQEQSQ